jgi:hypothetical protein
LYNSSAGVGIHLGDVDSIENGFIVSNALDESANKTDVLVSCHDIGMVDVIEVIGCIPIVFHDETRLAVFKEKPNPLSFVFGIPEAAQLEYPPWFGSVHQWISAPKIGPSPWIGIENRWVQMPEVLSGVVRFQGCT